MKKTEYRKIFWGIAVMVIVFGLLLGLPKAGKMLSHAYNALAANAPTLTGFDIPEGPPGIAVNVYGTGFTQKNIVNFGNIHIRDIPSYDGTSLAFNVPTSSGTSTPLSPGTYNVTISNDRGESNSKPYTLICDAGDCDDGSGTGNNGTSTPGGPYTGPIYTCHGGYNCIEGFKIPIGGIADDQIVTLDGRYRATTTSWSFDQIPPGLHTLSVTVPDGWYSGYTICINNVNCHSDIPIQGQSLTVNFLSTNQSAYIDGNGLLNVPAGSYLDLYWHFSQNFGDFGSAPTGLGNNGTITGTTTRRSQVDSYTAGAASGVGTEQGFLDSLLAATAQTAVNVLGCNIANIITPAIRGTIIGDQALLRNPQPVRAGGGGGASIIVNDSGFTGVVARLLPYVTGNTLQTANDLRFSRAANVGFPNQPSWDAVSYCLENAMLKYVQQSTLNWTNTAFNGNPAFVQNLGQFLLGVQNQTARNYFTQLQTTNASAPFHDQLIQGQIYNYNESQGTLPSYNPSATTLPGLDGWFALTQNDENNLYGASQQARNQLAVAIHNSREEELYKYQANRGYLNVDECTGSSKPNALGQPTNCLTKVTGTQVENKFNTYTDLPAQRAALNSGGYDQIVFQLINQLVQTALGQLFKNIGH